MHLDARWYNPQTQRFVQPDLWNFRNTGLPMAVRHELMRFTGLDTAQLLRDPGQQMGYGYVSGNPIRQPDLFGLAPPENIPEGVDIRKNIEEARGMGGIEYYNTVKNGGRWDYKQQGSQYEEFGNYNFGVTAAATGMFPGNIPNRMAGWAQERAGTSLPEWGGPWDFPPSSFGDDPEDQYWINEGIKDFNDGYFDLDGGYRSDCPKDE